MNFVYQPSQYWWIYLKVKIQLFFVAEFFLSTQPILMDLSKGQNSAFFCSRISYYQPSQFFWMNLKVKIKLIFEDEFLKQPSQYCWIYLKIKIQLFFVAKFFYQPSQFCWINRKVKIQLFFEDEFYLSTQPILLDESKGQNSAIFCSWNFFINPANTVGWI